MDRLCLRSHRRRSLERQRQCGKDLVMGSPAAVFLSCPGFPGVECHPHQAHTRAHRQKQWANNSHL